MKSQNHEIGDLKMRKAVGIILIRKDGFVWTGKRKLGPGVRSGERNLWQMPQGGIDDINHRVVSVVWLPQVGGQGRRLFVHGNSRSHGYRPDQIRQIACAIVIRGKWLWIDRSARLVIVKMASTCTVAPTDTDRKLLAAFIAITAALD